MKLCRWSNILWLPTLLSATAGLAGAQQFIQAPRYLAQEFNLSGVVSGDFNRDGNPDLAIANQCCSSVLVSIELGNGNGTFRSGQQIPGGSANAIVAGDWNGDGIIDLAVAAYPAATFVLLGNGDGTFSVANSYALSIDPLLIAAGDLNGD